MLLLIASEATVPFMSFFFDNPESPDRCPLMGPPRKLPASVPSAPLLAVRDGEEGHDEVEEVDALAAIRSGLPWKGPCPVLIRRFGCKSKTAFAASHKTKLVFADYAK